MFDEKMLLQLRMLASDHGISPASLMAVIEVESAGKWFATVEGKREPLIRFEGHYFYRLLSRAKRNIALSQGLAHWRAGQIKNPWRQSGRWNLLRQAAKIDKVAAYSSVSYGVGQVMGAHWRWLGYASIDHLVNEARSGFDGQVKLMMRFIVKSRLIDKLASNDWAGFARVYNGPAYAKHGYDKKLARSYRRFVEAGEVGLPGAPVSRHASTSLRIGSRGEVVRDLQKSLRSLGYTLQIDGDFGPATRQTVKNFQRDHRLRRDGIVGPKTFEMLARKLAPIRV